MKISREILCARSREESTANVFWTTNGISPQQLKQFWKWLWGIKWVRKLFVLNGCQFIELYHYSQRRKGVNADRTCQFCMHRMETIKHYLESCDFAMETWKRILKLLLQVYTWDWGVSSITIWYIWKIMCSKILQNVYTNPFLDNYWNLDRDCA